MPDTATANDLTVAWEALRGIAELSAGTLQRAPTIARQAIRAIGRFTPQFKPGEAVRTAHGELRTVAVQRGSWVSVREEPHRWYCPSKLFCVGDATPSDRDR